MATNETPECIFYKLDFKRNQIVFKKFAESILNLNPQIILRYVNRNTIRVIIRAEEIKESKDKVSQDWSIHQKDGEISVQFSSPKIFSDFYKILAANNESAIYALSSMIKYLNSKNYSEFKEYFLQDLI